MMKVTKQETGLYNFLKAVFDIGKNSKIKLIGCGKYIYFWSIARMGRYCQDSSSRIGMEYEFPYALLDLTMLPDGEFILKEDERFSIVPQEIHRIDGLLDNSSFAYEFNKEDECQLAKMTLLTHLLLCDKDLKYFNRFKDAVVVTTGSYIGMRSSYLDNGINCQTDLLFDTNGHEVELNQQMSMDIPPEEDDHVEDEKEVDDLIEETVEEAENDDFDPMSV